MKYKSSVRVLGGLHIGQSMSVVCVKWRNEGGTYLLLDFCTLLKSFIFNGNKFVYMHMKCCVGRRVLYIIIVVIIIIIISGSTVRTLVASHLTFRNHINPSGRTPLEE
jgi:hypothetical protein